MSPSRAWPLPRILLAVVLCGSTLLFVAVLGQRPAAAWVPADDGAGPAAATPDEPAAGDDAEEQPAGSPEAQAVAVLSETDDDDPVDAAPSAGGDEGASLPPVYAWRPQPVTAGTHLSANALDLAGSVPDAGLAQLAGPGVLDGLVPDPRLVPALLARARADMERIRLDLALLQDGSGRAPGRRARGTAPAAAGPRPERGAETVAAQACPAHPHRRRRRHPLGHRPRAPGGRRPGAVQPARQRLRQRALRRQPGAARRRPEPAGRGHGPPAPAD